MKAASLVSGSGSRCGCVSIMNGRLLSPVSQIVLSLTNLSYGGRELQTHCEHRQERNTAKTPNQKGTMRRIHFSAFILVEVKEVE